MLNLFLFYFFFIFNFRYFIKKVKQIYFFKKIIQKIRIPVFKERFFFIFYFLTENEFSKNLQCMIWLHRFVDLSEFGNGFRFFC